MRAAILVGGVGGHEFEDAPSGVAGSEAGWVVSNELILALGCFRVPMGFRVGLRRGSFVGWFVLSGAFGVKSPPSCVLVSPVAADDFGCFGEPFGAFIHPIGSLRLLMSQLGSQEMEFLELNIDESVKHYYKRQKALRIYERFYQTPIIYGWRLKKA
jgi:hypothetical protein